ncbi:MAG: type II toxin-antitoxin system RelE/ParE family toxin, partial [Selenomonadaceae bacterium]|nr:type II toxin-antitoxin system RelE/ParE family toxin [Selenomonadaceae bacterium]
MTSWKVIWWNEAKEDFAKLDRSQSILVRKYIQKVSQNPLPQNEGGYGKPLGNKLNTNLSGCYKIKLRDAGIRIVYRLQRTKHGMEIIIIGMRASAEVYDLAAKRI